MRRPYGSVMTQASRKQLPKRQMSSAQHRKKWTQAAYDALWASVARNTTADGLVDLMKVVDDTQRPVDVIVGKLAERRGITKDQVKSIVWLPMDIERRMAKARLDAGLRTQNTAKLRKCIHCQKMFHSEWIGNRRCIRCKSEH